jgi:hypothetical protein
MPAVLEGVERRATLASTIFLDVLVTEDIDMPGRVTRYPVEDGTEISDNINIEAESIRLAGLIAIADAVALESGAGENAGSKMVDVVESLRKMRKDRALVTCSTGQMVYQDYAFESLRASRANSDGGNWLNVEVELVKITKVELQTAEVPDRAQGAAAGRTGQTNKPAGRSASNSSANAGAGSGTGTNANQPRKGIGAASYDRAIDMRDSIDRNLRSLSRNPLAGATGAVVP